MHTATLVWLTIIIVCTRFRSASVLICGNESMHIEMRVRSIIEMALYPDHYCQPEVTSFLGGYTSSEDVSRKSAPRLHATSPNFVRAGECPIVGNIVMDTFIYDVISATREGCWATMWHVYALASVLGTPIRSVYPERNTYVRPLYHKVVHPRQASVAQPLIIMWTQTTYDSNPSKWSPNHFVPCIELTTSSATSHTSEFTHPQPASIMCTPTLHRPLTTASPTNC